MSSQIRNTVPQRTTLIALATFVVVSFQNCDAYHGGTALNQSSSSLDGFTLEVDQALQAQSLSILSNRCAACHDQVSSGNVTHILDVNHLITSGLVTPGDPNAGRIIGSIAAGTMPPGGGVSAADLQTIKNWVASMRLVGNVPAPSPTPNPLPAGKTVQVNPTLHTQAMNILNTNCAGCHFAGQASGGISNILDVNYLVSNSLVVVGDSTLGRLTGSVVDGSMPDGTGARVSAADLQTLRSWINSLTVVDDVGQAKPTMRAGLSPTFTGVFANIIQPKCIACHGPIRRDANLNLSTYQVVFNNRNNILQQCQSGGMPDPPYPRIVGDELTALQTWIQSGAPNN